MPLEPIDIKNKEFSRSFLGADIREVRQFLAQVSDRVENLKQSIAELDGELRSVREERDRLEEQEDQVKELLKMARNVTDEIKQGAREEANRIKERARHKAEEIRADAVEEADALREETANLKTQFRRTQRRLDTLSEELKELAQRDVTPEDAPARDGTG